MTILELIEISHILGKDRGFWEKNKDIREELLYVISDVGDIAKALKKNKRADWKIYDQNLFVLEHSNRTEEYIKQSSKLLFDIHIKNTFEDEIINTILRITDLFGGKNVDIVKANTWLENYIDFDLNYFFHHVKPRHDFDKESNVSHFLTEAIALCMTSDNEFDYGLSNILFYLGAIIEFYEIDAEKHIVKKIEYNRTRPMKYENNV